MEKSSGTPILLGTRFRDFVEDSLDSAPEREEIFRIADDAQKLLERIDNERK